jgi:anhydro-N-acetylmuramic acid kinase
LLRHAPDASGLLVCGGGARNNHLMALLQQKLPGIQVGTTAEYGIPVDCVEAVAFAWLARCHVKRQPGNLPAVTGAAGLRLLGALYPAG